MINFVNANVPSLKTSIEWMRHVVLHNYTHFYLSKGEDGWGRVLIHGICLYHAEVFGREENYLDKYSSFS